MKKIGLTSLAVLTATPALAHDTWLIPSVFRAEPAQPVTLRFATSEAFPTSDAPLALDRVAQFSLRSAGSGPQPVMGYRQEGKFLVASVTPYRAGHAVVVAETKPRFLEMKPADFHEYISHEELRHVVEARIADRRKDAPGRELYRKIAKTILHRARQPVAGGDPGAQSLRPARGRRADCARALRGSAAGRRAPGRGL